MLFGSAVVIGLVWVIFWGMNEIRKNKATSYRKEIAILTNNIDSLKSTFPKAKNLNDIIIGEIPKEGNYFIPDPLEILGTDAEKAQMTNLRQLYSVLSNSHFTFIDKEQNNIPRFLYFKVFKDSLDKEINNDTLNLDSLSSKPFLKHVYDFLIEKQKTKASIQELVLTIKGMPLPPPHSVWAAYQKSKTEKDNLSKKLESVNSSIYSSHDLTDIAKWICIIVLIIVYPLRLFYATLLWAIKTLRQK